MRAKVSRAAFFVLGVSSLAHAQEIQLTGPLRGAPSLRHRWVWREGRVEVSPILGAAAADPRHPVGLTGIEAVYYPFDEIGFGFFGASALVGGGTAGALRSIASPELVLVPWSGKTAFFHQIYFPFDVHLRAGGARVTTYGRETPGAEVAGTLGAGFTGFASQFFSMGVDYRAVLRDSVNHIVTLSFGLWPQRHYDLSDE